MANPSTGSEILEPRVTPARVIPPRRPGNPVRWFREVGWRHLVGIAAVIENRATNLVCRRAPPPRAFARRFAIRRPPSTSSAIAGMRLAIKISATVSGDKSAR